MPVSGTTKTALLQVNCALGDVPRERSVEGIRLIFEKGGIEFFRRSGWARAFPFNAAQISPPA
jgi:hypothetical protein